MNNILWYNKKASEWKEGLPIGTGRLAGMILGDPVTERIALNHEWLCTGYHKHREPGNRSSYLEKVRELLKAEDYEEAANLANEAWGGNGGISDRPTMEDSYQPAGDLFFTMEQGEVSNYRRELDLDKALVTVSYDADGRHITRRMMAHLKEDVLMASFDAGKAAFNAELTLARVFDERCSIDYDIDGSTLIMNGEFNGGMKFAVKLDIFTDGCVSHGKAKCGSLEPETEGSAAHNARLIPTLKVTNAKNITVYINIGTDANHNDPYDEIHAYTLPTGDFEQLLKENIKEHEEHYGRLKFNLEGSVPDVPTDERIRLYRDKREDVTLPALYFNYGRYLLCASSARGKLPANLQGKWNDEIRPAWDCDYHNDINVQMCYWPAEAGNLSEYTDALFTFLEKMVPEGKKAAKAYFGCKGIWFPLSTDIWGACTTETYGWSVWVGAAAWLAQHMWQHYEYTLDKCFLKERCYPFIREVARFFEDYLVKDENGVYQISPSQSPENRFTLTKTMPVSICVSSASDIEMTGELLGEAIQCAKILETDEGKVAKWQEMLDNLPKLQISEDGRIVEWNRDFEEAEPGHRHVSHLYGIYPGNLFDEDKTPKLYKAARVSLEKRLAAGGGYTGWSRAWTAALYARFKDGEKAAEHLKALIGDFATESLLDLHPPRIFQIDGNLGGTAAILEMLLNSADNRLEFLPAIPKEWKSGSVQGIRARGNITVDMDWKDGCLTKAVLRPGSNICCTIRTKKKMHIEKLNGKPVEYRFDGKEQTFDLRAGEPVICTGE